MSEQKSDTAAVVAVLNKIMEMELAGVVRYTHYSLMVFGYNRIPIVSWLRAQATESLAHAQEAGEPGHPSWRTSFTSYWPFAGNAPAQHR